ncbi:MAG: hypothetical protein LCH37_03945 [Bacteroidetes bacterium]|nr:hypothetical protein [Bacteroidota bacterium]
MKNKKEPFRESQRFTQWWVWVVLIGTGTLPYIPYFTGAYSQGSASGLVGSSIIMLIMALLFLVLRLETTIDEDGIRIQFFPFHFKSRFYSWNEIKRMGVRQYSPLREYGGWGIRGLSKKNRAFNVKGNWGLQLEFENGDLLLIGTSKPEELQNWLDS